MKGCLEEGSCRNESDPYRYQMTAVMGASALDSLKTLKKTRQRSAAPDTVDRIMRDMNLLLAVFVASLRLKKGLNRDDGPAITHELAENLMQGGFGTAPR